MMTESSGIKVLLRPAKLMNFNTPPPVSLLFAFHCSTIWIWLYQVVFITLLAHVQHAHTIFLDSSWKPQYLQSLSSHSFYAGWLWAVTVGGMFRVQGCFCALLFFFFTNTVFFFNVFFYIKAFPTLTPWKEASEKECLDPHRPSCDVIVIDPI